MEIAGYGHRPRQHPAPVGRPESTGRWTCPSSPGASTSRPWSSEAMAEVIAKVLYPEDNHYEGKSLRLKQQYFFVSATVQSIVTHVTGAQYGTLRQLPRKARHPDQRHPPGPGHPGADAHPAWTRRAMTWDEAWAHHHPVPWPTPTTPSWPRPWSAGPSSLVRVPAAPRVADPAGDRPPLPGEAWRTSTTTRPRSANMAIIWGGRGAHGQPVRLRPACRSTACPASTPRS